ncbi:nucleoid-associated protein [Neobacillus sp. PS3-12]|uniref:nucleoid-associated protein n=1 Tax=Neobacillus sp. PS3-12 TaxID=3070677 RepID=UPI0027E0E816|nr:nucleoid-associated protein [Neobacillus sp. PS3-12]WML54330.1 nucleoid-associated protein [Neobacillus sp. PS3-12]
MSDSTATLEQKIKINRLAINVLDLDYSDPNTSKKLFPLGEANEIIDNFFETHFTDTRHGKSTKSCKFIDSDATVKTKINRYFENKNDENFLVLSRELTENLFKIMKNSTSNSSGTFFVMEIEYNGEECIFIIKLDPKHGLQINYIDLTVSVLQNILPDSNDRVHKCAIIRYKKPEDSEADLFVMDKQQKEGEPARFFIETYLQAEEILNNKIITREVVRSAREQLVQILPAVEANKIYEFIDKEFTNGSRIQLETAIRNILENTVPNDKEDRELFIHHSASNFIQVYLEKNPDHQTSFVAERKDHVVIWRSEKDQIFFRYNKGIMNEITFATDDHGNTIITIDKSLNFKRDVK